MLCLSKVTPHRQLHALLLPLDSMSPVSRLLSSFHTTVAEITIIATPDSEVEPGQACKTVQMRSFNDPAKGDSMSLRKRQYLNGGARIGGGGGGGAV